MTERDQQLSLGTVIVEKHTGERGVIVSVHTTHILAEFNGYTNMIRNEYLKYYDAEEKA